MDKQPENPANSGLVHPTLSSNSKDNPQDSSRSNISQSGNYGFRSNSTESWRPYIGTGLSNLTFFSLDGGRRKTISESSDASSIETDPLGSSPSTPTVKSDYKGINRSSSTDTMEARLSGSDKRGQNLSFGNSSQVVYDIDGKFPYSYYESKPTLYDIDGIHRYKHYGAYKPTPYTDCAPHHEKRPWIYDPAEGMIMCLTAKDLKTQKWRTQELNKNKT